MARAELAFEVFRVPLRWTQVLRALTDAGTRTVEDIENKWQLVSTTMKMLGVDQGRTAAARQTNGAAVPV